uniref:cDNA FLJ59982, highly similar to DNA methyltransferase 1-associated protein 1 n=1 Tax=Homo sapiens TaxID=9606 RepID=B4DTU6_HUMAN|nr:unnamed protein product [Homo sapiens]
MATGADVRDILELGGPEGDAASGTISKKDIINPDKKKSKKSSETLTFKRPEGMHREVYALLYSDKKDAPPLLPSDTGQGYRTVKAKLGSKKVRPWKWMPFTNPARKDGAMFFHWRRAAEEGKDYPFARFNKVSYLHSDTGQDCPPTLSHLCELSSLLGLVLGARLCPTVITHSILVANACRVGLCGSFLPKGSCSFPDLLWFFMAFLGLSNVAVPQSCILGALVFLFSTFLV